MAKMSALQQEVLKVEQDVNVLAQVRNWIAAGKTVNDVDAEMNVLSSVHQRLVAALPPVKTRQPRKKSEVTGAAAKPNGKGKQATA